MSEKLTALLKKHAGQRPELPAGRDPHRRKPDRALRRRFIWDALAAAWPRRAVWLVLVIAVVAIAACASSSEEGAPPTATLAATAIPQETPTATLAPSATPEETATPSPAPAQTAGTSATPEPPANSAETPPQPELAAGRAHSDRPRPRPGQPRTCAPGGHLRHPGSDQPLLREKPAAGASLPGAGQVYQQHLSASGR
ncbi:MAG: hypothetical protein V9H69_18595 [Anaerolineae bacterium]